MMLIHRLLMVLEEIFWHRMRETTKIQIDTLQLIQFADVIWWINEFNHGVDEEDIVTLQLLSDEIVIQVEPEEVLQTILKAEEGQWELELPNRLLLDAIGILRNVSEHPEYDNNSTDNGMVGSEADIVQDIFADQVAYRNDWSRGELNEKINN